MGFKFTANKPSSLEAVKCPRGHHFLFPSTNFNPRISTCLFKLPLMLKPFPSVLAISKVSAASAPTSVSGDEHSSACQAGKAQVKLYHTTNHRWPDRKHIRKFRAEKTTVSRSYLRHRVGNYDFCMIPWNFTSELLSVYL